MRQDERSIRLSQSFWFTGASWTDPVGRVSTEP